MILETPRLLLRTMQQDDLDGLLEIFGDPKVMASFHEPPFTHEQMQGWLQRNLDHQNEFGYGLFSVIHKDSGVLIGDCGLERMDEDGDVAAEVGYDLRSDYWNRGYATEAAKVVRDYAFQTLELPQLISLIRVGNLASKRVAEKIGMQLLSEYERYGNHYWKYGQARPTE
jgi:RimJ/RimL family protein N-acetyltransferase